MYKLNYHYLKETKSKNMKKIIAVLLFTGLFATVTNAQTAAPAPVAVPAAPVVIAA